MAIGESLTMVEQSVEKRKVDNGGMVIGKSLKTVEQSLEKG
jgi:hypothetical protein